MPETSFEVQRDDRGFVRFSVRGPFTESVVVQTQVVAAGEYAGLDQLWDLTAADTSFWTQNAMRHLVADSAAPERSFGAIRVAVLTRGDLAFGLARQWSALAESRLPFESAVFRDERAALAWLLERDREQALNEP
ncbi:MAG: hypothetical protein DRQ55_12660 [Planctomycetota bacterium]|nr:MAG: hypothetical protein DRQ55_12660 [Planctomycetota bacterium]